MNGESRRRIPTIALVAIVAVGTVVTLHATAVVPLAYRSVPLSSVQAFQGFAYAAAIPAAYPENFEPDVHVFENGTPYPYPAFPGWGAVATTGNGRFHVQPGTVYFSALDNSDPRTNGRQYSATMPWPLSRWVVRAVWVVTAIALLMLLFRDLERWRRLIAAPPFWIPAAVLIAGVIANRAWYFLDFPMLAIHPDSGSYFGAVEMMGTAEWPNFGNRPPFYPIFLKTVFEIRDRAGAVAVAQTLLSTGAALLMVWACYRWRRWLGLPAAITLSLFLFGFTTLEHDTAMLSESVYSSLLVIAYAALLLGIRARSGTWLAASSAAMALAILTRPAGMFLLVVYLIVLAWMVWQRFGRLAVVAFLIPFPALLIAQSYYNMRVVRVFAPTTWGEANLAVATFLAWQTDPSYPPSINADIEKIRAILQQRLAYVKKDIGVLDRSWQPLELGSIFVEGFNQDALNIAVKMGGAYETEARAWIRTVAFDAVRKRPRQYAKFVFAMLAYYFWPIPEYDFRVYLLNRAHTFYVARYFAPEKGVDFLVRLGKEFANAHPPPAVVITNPDPAVEMALNDRILLKSTRAWRIYDLTHRARRMFFQRMIWPASVLIALLGSLWVLARTRCRHEPAFVVFIIAVSAIGAGLVVSLVEFSQPRYSYPMEWTYSLSLILLPLLFAREEPR